MNISFNEIPNNTRTPGVFIEIDHTKSGGIGTEQHRLLLIGQRETLNTGVLHEPVRLGSQAGDQVATLWGEHSMLHMMASAARTASANVDIWAMAVEFPPMNNATAAKAVVQIETSGAQESGSLNVYIAGFPIRVPVAAGESADTLTNRLFEIISNTPGVPVYAVYVAKAGGPVCELTCSWSGTSGNQLDLRLNHYTGEKIPQGVTVTLTPFVGGTGVVDITPALDAIISQQYYSIVCPYTDPDSLLELELEMDRRYQAMVAKTGHVFNVVSGSHSQLTSFGNGRNSPHLSTFGAYRFLTAPWVIASVWATVVEYYGSQDPARPFTTLPLPGVIAPSDKDQFSREERNQLLFDGISTFTVSQGGQVLIEQVLTNYQVNSYNLPDEAYLKLNTKWTADYMRERFSSAVASAFPRYKLGDFSLPGQPIATEASVRGVLVAEAIKLYNEGLLEDLEDFKAKLIVRRSPDNNQRMNAVLSPNLVNQFDVFAGSLQFIL